MTIISRTSGIWLQSVYYNDEAEVQRLDGRHFKVNVKYNYELGIQLSGRLIAG